MRNEAKIFEALKKASIILGGEQEKERLILFTERLKRHDAKDVEKVIFSLCEEKTFFPSLAEILNKLERPINIDDEANEISAKIIKAISQYGPDRFDEARKDIGEHAALVAETYGWRSLCAITYKEISTVRAQLRELAKGLTRKSIKGGRDKKRIEADINNLLSAAKG